MAVALEIVHEVDPREDMLKNLMPLVEDWHILRPQVLVGVYEPTGEVKTKGGLLLADQTKTEYTYQGKTGLVLKVGELAFVEDAEHRWGSKVPQVGDWVQFFVGDARAFKVGKWTCRYIEDVHVQAIVPSPTSAY